MGFIDKTLGKLFGNKSDRDLKELAPYLASINKEYDRIKQLDINGLRAESQLLKDKIQDYIKAEKDEITSLKKEIEEGRFREDLYHRLAVILIKVPALNDRREDIPLLVDFFAKKISEEQGMPKKGFSEDAIKLLQEYDWTGNIRELRNVVERLLILGEKEVSKNDVKLFASK